MDIGAGHILSRSAGPGGQPKFKLNKPDRWQVVWVPSGQNAGPVAADYEKWQYYDPMWEAGVWIENSLLPAGGADSETLCGSNPGGEHGESKDVGLPSDYPVTQ